MSDADIVRRRDAENLLRAAIDILDQNGLRDQAAAIAANHISLAIEHLNPAGYTIAVEDEALLDAASPGSLA